MGQNDPYCRSCVNIKARVFSKLFSFHTPFGKYNTAFDGKVEATCIVHKQLTSHLCKFKNIVLLSDSWAAIQSIVIFRFC